MRPDNPLPIQLLVAEKAIQDVALGKRVCAAISGDPGIGKTHLVRTVCQSLGVPWSLQSGSIAGLKAAAYQHAKGGHVMVIDDADALVVSGGEATANVMKALLGGNLHGREIINETQAAYDNLAAKSCNPAIAPPRFVTRVGVIWITNIDLSDGLAHLKPKMRAHVDALFSRGLFPVSLSREPLDCLEFILDTVQKDREILGWTEVLPSGARNPVKMKVNLASQNDALTYFVTNSHKIEISFRCLLQIVKTRYEHPDIWTVMLDQMLAPRSHKPFPRPDIPVITPERLRMAAE